MTKLEKLGLSISTRSTSDRKRHLRRVCNSPALYRSLAMTAALALSAQAHAMATYSFQSGLLADYNANDASSFTLEFTTPVPLADGIYQWGANNIGQVNANFPSDASFKFTDGYTTITDPADLSPGFTFQITGGTINQVAGDLGLYAEDPSHYDPYYGYTLFYIGGGGHSQLQDVTDPQIVGLDYAGHHIPVAGGSNGAWTYSFVSSVPEPGNISLMLAGLSILLATWGRTIRRAPHPHPVGLQCSA